MARRRSHGLAQCLAGMAQALVEDRIEFDQLDFTRRQLKHSATEPETALSRPALPGRARIDNES